MDAPALLLGLILQHLQSSVDKDKLFILAFEVSLSLGTYRNSCMKQNLRSFLCLWSHSSLQTQLEAQLFRKSP